MRWPLIFALASLVGCSSPAPKGYDNHWDNAGPSATGDGALTPLAVGRQPRRLSVSQLDRTLRVTFGVPWTIDGTPVEVLPFLASILGQPDYLTENLETLDATPVFAKFMDNMASKMCFDAVSADGANMNVDARNIARYPDDVARNLRYLRLRLHGIYVPPTETTGLSDLMQLHEELRSHSPTQYGVTFEQAFPWIGVCVAMVTDPEFMVY